MNALRRSAMAILLTAGWALGACANSDDGASTPETAGGSSVPNSEFNEADVTFAQGMIPHHTQAVEMATIALNPATAASDDVRDLAARIKSAQDPEIEQMTGWLTTWDQPVEVSGMSAMDMDGMMTDDELDALSGLTGDEFDRAWTDMMIRHHEGAIAMAETELDAGSNADMIDLANEIITAQRAEIEEMRS